MVISHSTQIVKPLPIARNASLIDGFKKIAYESNDVQKDNCTRADENYPQMQELKKPKRN